MKRFSHAALIILSGVIWFAVGCFLMSLGARFLVNAITLPGAPLLQWMSSLTGGKEESALILVLAALLVGKFKAKKVLSKAAGRGISRLHAMSAPLSLTALYSKPYLLLLALMMAMGMGMNFLGVPKDIRGLVDLTVGAALIQGSLYYFKAARA